MVRELEPAEIRVLGCLIEKQRATPDAYPLTLNSLVLACNQSTGRDPVVAYDEATVRRAAERLGTRGWLRFASGRGSRATKYRHLLDQALGLGAEELAVLGVLMLRGDQTSGELRSRTERLHAFPDTAAVEATLERLAVRDLAAAVPRRPGQKEGRFAQLLGPAPEEDERGAPRPVPVPATVRDPAPSATRAAAPPPSAAASSAPAEADASLHSRLALVEDEVRGLREELVALRRELGA